MLQIVTNCYENFVTLQKNEARRKKWSATFALFFNASSDLRFKNKNFYQLMWKMKILYRRIGKFLKMKRNWSGWTHRCTCQKFVNKVVVNMSQHEKVGGRIFGSGQRSKSVKLLNKNFECGSTRWFLRKGGKDLR